MDFFLNADVGIVQMPCPEFFCLGLARGNIHGADYPVVIENTRIRTEMQKNGPNRKRPLEDFPYINVLYEQ